MAEMIKLKSTAADGFEFGAYRAEPQGRRRGGVIVIQEIFGIDQYVRADVERWAGLGFEAIAPSMYDRVKPGLDVGHDDAGMAEAFAAMRAAKPDDALADLAACVAFLKPKGPVFVVGYCYGGAMTWQAAGRLEGIAAASSYYGGGVAGAADLTPKCPTICHFGRKDGHIPADEVKATINAAQPNVSVYIYENSGHGFNNDGRPDSDADDAALARKRTLELFERNGAL
ncbi:MAG TPA: dienelactone hydrolase family protein [Caulobacteraceae bacterium]|jgi:carboxymethylenebutenolidase|nr:dienelactone hydrolase family protein [Caulobacteraceae bacterium]